MLTKFQHGRKAPGFTKCGGMLREVQAHFTVIQSTPDVTYSSPAELGVSRNGNSAKGVGAIFVGDLQVLVPEQSHKGRCTVHRRISLQQRQDDFMANEKFLKLPVHMLRKNTQLYSPKIYKLNMKILPRNF